VKKEKKKLSKEMGKETTAEHNTGTDRTRNDMTGRGEGMKESETVGRGRRTLEGLAREGS